MQLKKVLSLLMALTMLAGIFTGCKEKVAAPDNTATDTGSTQFDWQKYAGSTIKVSFVQHSTSEAIIAKIPEFEAKTGITVEHSITPEANYFDKVSTSLSSRSGDPDLFMAGAYQLWDYSSAGYVQDLGTYLNDSAMVEPDYDYSDLVPSAVDALKWDGVAGHKVGTGAQLALPLCFEIYSLAYNTEAFKKANLKVPTTLAELADVSAKLKEWNGPGSYGLAIRGARDWGTIHPGYMSTFANYGATDFAVEDNKLVSKVNSPESVSMNEYWVNLIKTGCAPSWSSYTWYEAGADLGAGKAAMLFDADNNGVQQNWDGASQEAGKIAWTTMPVVNAGDAPKSNFWIWSMAMNQASKNKEAAWYFLMYFTSKDFAHYASVTGNSVDPCRTSVWESADFQSKMAKQTGYIDTYNKTIANATILFTPQPSFFETTTDWAATLQDMVAGKYKSIQAGLDDLKAKMDKAVDGVSVTG